MCNVCRLESTYRAVIDSLVYISKLTLSYAAAQLYPVPLDLIIPRWERGAEKKKSRKSEIGLPAVLHTPETPITVDMLLSDHMDGAYQDKTIWIVSGKNILLR